jgi:hypothetical protein
MQGIGAMFNGWQETDDKGRTVEVTIQPARDQKGTVVPSEDMDGWIRPREVVGTGGRTFNNLEKDNRVKTMVRNMATAIDGYLAALEGAQENSVQDKSAYDSTLINAAVNAVRISRFPQDLSETADLKAYEAEIGKMIEWVDDAPPNVAVDGMWALLRDAAMPQEVKDVLLSQLNAAVLQDDPTQMHTAVEESASNLKLMRRQIIATAPDERSTSTFVQGAQNYARGVLRLVSDSLPTDGVIPAALLLLPSDIVKKQELASKLFGAMKNAESVRTADNDIFADPMQRIEDVQRGDGTTVSGKPGLRGLDPVDEKGDVKPLKEDLSGRFIDYGKDIAAGKRRSVVSSERAEARAAPPPTNSAAWLADPELVRGIVIEQQVRVEDSGEVVTVTEDAADVLAGLSARQNVLERLQGCV